MQKNLSEPLCAKSYENSVSLSQFKTLDGDTLQHGIIANDDNEEMIYMAVDDDKMKRKSTFWNPENLNEFINSSEFSKIISNKPDVTHGQLFFMVLKFSAKNHLPNSVTNNLFQLLNTMFDSPVLPETKYINDKILNPRDGVKLYAVCKNCSVYIGEFGEETLPEVCHLCANEANLTQSTDESFFAVIDPSLQIRDLLQCHEDHYDDVMNRIPNDDRIEDIYDGKMYREFRAQLPSESEKSYITTCLNTDGAPKYKCSKKSIWPLYLMINELPKQARLNNVVCSGLWFNKKKPNMSVFLQKFVDMFNSITSNGILCNLKNKDVIIKPFMITCCVDAPARAAVQGMKQFNGNFGCNWCIHKGRKDGAMLYQIMNEVPRLRTKTETVAIMLNFAEQSDIILGIKYPSPLICLPFFDIIEGMIPDYMHCCLEGVAARMLNYFLQNTSDDKIEELDDQIVEIAPPNQLQRLTRPISERNDWKAREWENFVLYYSITLLEPIISPKKFNHWLLFVEAMYIILQDTIKIEDLNLANKLFHTFVADMEENHGKRAMTYNTHILLHICRSVFHWGPVWANSTFCFESANRHMLNAIKCARGASHQIVRYVNLNHNLLVLENSLPPVESEHVLRYCNEVLESKVKYALTSHNGITYFGRLKYVSNEMAISLGISTNSVIFYKMAKSGCSYESFKLKKKRSNNSFALLDNGTYVKIVSAPLHAGLGIDRGPRCGDNGGNGDKRDHAHALANAPQSPPMAYDALKSLLILKGPHHQQPIE
ncbi:hypothetical protein TKK_0013884 [Trichogramma kaykai]